MRVSEANAVHIHFGGTAGRGRPALVFVNPLGTDYRVWHAVASRLPCAWPHLLYDKRGHGLSGAPKGDYTIGDHVEDLAALLRGLGISQTVICGLSVGGMIAQGLAVAYPERVRGLILCGTAARIGTQGLWDARIRDVQHNGMEAAAHGIMERWFSETFRVRHTSEIKLWRSMLTCTPLDGYLGTCAALRDADMGRVAQKISVPTLCIAATNDHSTPPQVVEELAGLIPAARYSLIDGPGHLMCVEAPDALAGLIGGFFEEHGL